MVTSRRLGGAVVDERVLLRQRHVGGARRPAGGLPAPPQEAVPHDGQQGQDAHRQNHSQSDGAWRTRQRGHFLSETRKPERATLRYYLTTFSSRRFATILRREQKQLIKSKNGRLMLMLASDEQMTLRS